MAPRKPKCSFEECSAKAQPIVGDCDFCKKVYCGTHRLLEEHKCEGLEDCKKAAYDANAAQLQAERTQVVKCV